MQAGDVSKRHARLVSVVERRRHLDRGRRRPHGGRLDRLGPASRPVLVVGVLGHVQRAQALRLVDERPLLDVIQTLPVGAEALGDLRVVHLGVVVRHSPTLAT